MAAVLHVPGRTRDWLAPISRCALERSSRTQSRRLWRLPGSDCSRSTLGFADDQHPPSRSATLHATTHLPDRHLTMQSTASRSPTPCERSSTSPHASIPCASSGSIDTAWSIGLVTGPAAPRDARRPRRARARPGIQVMRELLEERGADYRPPDSNLEARFQELMTAIGIHTLRASGRGRRSRWRIGRVDFSDRRARRWSSRSTATPSTAAVIDQRADDRRASPALDDAGFVDRDASPTSMSGTTRKVRSTRAGERGSPPAPLHRGLTAPDSCGGRCHRRDRCARVRHAWATGSGGWTGGGQERGKPRTCSSSARATAGSVTLMVSIPMRRAGLRFTPRSSRNTASVGSMSSVVQAIS